MLRPTLRAVFVLSIAAAAWLLQPWPSRAVARVEPPTNVVLLAIDTTRADRVSSSGYGRATTPNLDRFARQGVRFSNAYSVSSWTLPALASLLTGLWPHHHGAYADGLVLPDDSSTLASVLHDNGYKTAAVSANFAYFHPKPRRRDGHFAIGFDSFQVMAKIGSESDRECELMFGRMMRTVRADDVTSRVRDFVLGTREPFFVSALYIDPHYGYAALPDYAGMFATPGISPTVSGFMRDSEQLAHPLTADDVTFLSDEYDSEIRYVDEYIGDLVRTIDESELSSRTIIVVVADHGEEFAEHGKTLHGQSLYEESIRVPLLIRGPGVPAGVTVEHPVSIIDVVPTILELTGLPVPGNLDGVSLGPLWETHWWDAWGRRKEPETPRDLLFELDNGTELLNGPRTHTRAIRRGDWKLIQSLDGRQELFNLADDPGERDNLAEGRAQIVATLGNALRGAAPAVETEAVPLTEQEQERLHALGYLR